MDDQILIDKLRVRSKQMRKLIIEMIYKAGQGHPGGALSSVEIVAALYFHFMHYDPINPSWPERDRFILSKGHACPVHYVALALAGFLPMEELCTLRQFGSKLQGHPDMNKLPGLDMTSGSLGHGLGLALGMALGGKIDGKDYYSFVILGDGEIQEGLVWEAAMAASHYKLDRLVAYVDCNGLQSDGWINDVITIDPVPDKWRAFGWHVQEIDGHDFNEIISATKEALQVGAPAVILAKTVKGKGVSFMENAPQWHAGTITEEEYYQAIKEIEEGA